MASRVLNLLIVASALLLQLATMSSALELKSATVVFGDNAFSTVRTAVNKWLTKSGVAVNIATECSSTADVCFAFGNSSIAKGIISADQYEALGPEGYARVMQGSVVAVDARGTGIGVSYGVYEVLEAMGFYFFHPLSPSIPAAPLTLSFTEPSITTNPRWPIRSFHYHTEVRRLSLPHSG